MVGPEQPSGNLYVSRHLRHRATVWHGPRTIAAPVLLLMALFSRNVRVQCQQSSCAADDPDNAVTKSNVLAYGENPDELNNYLKTKTCIPDNEFYGFDGVANFGDMAELTHIGQYAFKECTGTVSFGAMPKLVSIEVGAFKEFIGRLTIQAGDCPKLSSIGSQAFMEIASRAEGDESSVAFGAMPALAMIGVKAFHGGFGTLRIEAGDCPLLTELKDYTFSHRYHTTASTMISFGKLSGLTAIGNQIFAYSKVEVHIAAGDMPKLKTWGISFMYECSNSKSTVQMGAMPSLTGTWQSAFFRYRGRLTIATGDMPQLSKVHDRLFGDCTHDQNSVSIGKMELLNEVGTKTFQNYQGMLNFNPGPVPSLSLIDENAFAFAGNSASQVWFSDVKEISIGNAAFRNFLGKIDFNGHAEFKIGSIGSNVFADPDDKTRAAIAVNAKSTFTFKTQPETVLFGDFLYHLFEEGIFAGEVAYLDKVETCAAGVTAATVTDALCGAGYVAKSALTNSNVCAGTACDLDGTPADRAACCEATIDCSIKDAPGCAYLVKPCFDDSGGEPDESPYWGFIVNGQFIGSGADGASFSSLADCQSSRAKHSCRVNGPTDVECNYSTTVTTTAVTTTTNTIKQPTCGTGGYESGVTDEMCASIMPGATYDQTKASTECGANPRSSHGYRKNLRCNLEIGFDFSVCCKPPDDEVLAANPEATTKVLTRVLEDIAKGSLEGLTVDEIEEAATTLLGIASGFLDAAGINDTAAQSQSDNTVLLEEALLHVANALPPSADTIVIDKTSAPNVSFVLANVPIDEPYVLNTTKLVEEGHSQLQGFNVVLPPFTSIISHSGKDGDTDNSTKRSAGIAIIVYEAQEVFSAATSMHTISPQGLSVKFGDVSTTGQKFVEGSYVTLEFPVGDDQKRSDLKDNPCGFYIPTNPLDSVPEYANRTGTWSTDGCRQVKDVAAAPALSGVDTGALVVTCECNHLTHFAVLFLTRSSSGGVSGGLEPDGKHAQILTYATYVGGGIGTLALLVTLVGFGMFRDTVELPETIVANLAVALLSGMLLFVAAGDPSVHAEGGSGCSITAGALHYLFLSVWTWQMAEAWHLTEQLISVFNARKTIWPFALAGWGAPLLFVIPSAAVWPEAYGSESVCWIQPSKATPAVWFFVAPALLCLLVCIVSIIRIMRTISSDATTSRWTQVKAFVTFGSVLGLTQIFGALMVVDAANGATGDASVAFAYLFTIVSSRSARTVLPSFPQRKVQKRVEDIHTFKQQQQQREVAPVQYQKRKISEDPARQQLNRGHFDPRQRGRCCLVEPVVCRCWAHGFLIVRWSPGRPVRHFNLLYWCSSVDLEVYFIT